MKLIIHRVDGPPIVVEGADRVHLDCGPDHFFLREQPDSLLVRLETHDGGLATQVVLIPNGSNGVLLKGGMR